MKKDEELHFIRKEVLKIKMFNIEMKEHVKQLLLTIHAMSKTIKDYTYDGSDARDRLSPRNEDGI